MQRVVFLGLGGSLLLLVASGVVLYFAPPNARLVLVWAVRGGKQQKATSPRGSTALDRWASLLLRQFGDTISGKDSWHSRGRGLRY